MFEELPQVHFSEVLTARGEIQVEHETAPVARFKLSRNKHDPRSSWEFEIFVSEESRADFDRVLHRRSFPKFAGKTFTGHSLEVPELRWRRWVKTTGTLTGVVWDVMINAEALPAKPHRQAVTIRLSPTSLALEEKPFLTRWYTGEIKYDERLSPEPDEKLLYWDSSRGRMTLVCHFDYETARVGDSQSLVRIPVSTLQLRLEGDQTLTDPRSLAESISKEIEGPLRLISFLSRSHVRWTGTKISSQWKSEDGKPAFHELHWFRGGVLDDEKSSRDWGLANAHAICALIERYKVQWNDIWPSEPLEQGVQKMFKVRNDFVHTGHLDMEGRAYIAARRAHIVGERLAWAILGGKGQWEDVRSHQRTDVLLTLEKELEDEKKG